jgi:pyridoxal phosphate enzyme (YggS family)
MNSEFDHRFGTDPKSTLVRRLAKLNTRIEKVCHETDRDIKSVRLLPVTKTVPSYILRHAFDVGLKHFAENKVQEAQNKIKDLHDLPVHWSMVGHLQTNKIKNLTAFAKEFHALDSIKIAEKLNNSLKADKKKMAVYIQINTSGEPSKYGLQPDELASFLESISEYEHLELKGLMTLAVFSKDRNKVRTCFELLRRLRDSSIVRCSEIKELSMGMTNDFEDAIREGSNVIRIGEGIFGNRPTPDGHYWPK